MHWRVRAHAHARVPLRRASPSDPSATERQPPCWVWCAGINVLRGGFLACHRTDDYTMPAQPEGLETQLQRSWVSRGWSWRPLGSGAAEGSGMRSERTRHVSKRRRSSCIKFCLFVQGSHCCVPGRFSRVPRFPACHACLIATTTVALAALLL